MKKTGFWILLTGMALILAMPSMAQKRVSVEDIKAAQKRKAMVQVDDGAQATTPVTNSKVVTPATQQAPPAIGTTVPLTCTWDKTIHDFGTSVLHQHPASATYTVTNKGTVPVTITEVTTTCGCTSRKFSKEPIKPGETGTVSLEYDAKISGMFTKSAIVKMNDGQKYVLVIKGEVQKVSQ